ncbi:hypothetical protein CTAYLR_004709 [Chrysophaeum taylorii]|uniref:Zeta toxin domain-containing protein n=1 Tax=Chrysophaeum taylorii TaxID=2483200 RepID=A0AAD7XIN8_9STRA|nr:hypothetical protein CTAYLR_004709 [Chrysophaeum taylorii]
MSGLPGSGKTRVIEALYGESKATILDLDAEICRHVDYDESEAAKIYESMEAYNWADAVVEAKFRRSIADDKIRVIVVDGTGTKVDRRLRRIAAAKHHGLATVLLYVNVTIETALRRNERRRRVVPEDRLRDYRALSEIARERVAPAVDCYEVINNDVDVPDRDDQIAAMRRDANLRPCVLNTTSYRRRRRRRRRQ